jgi:hypothetical protein
MTFEYSSEPQSTEEDLIPSQHEFENNDNNNGLGSKTPIQLIQLSNYKLNQEIFSSRSHSIQRRILIKNFLTSLYQSHPMEWIEETPVDEKDHWMEQTLSAAGIGQQQAQAQQTQQTQQQQDDTSAQVQNKFFFVLMDSLIY